MRLLKLCEEKGSGVDKVVSSMEAMYLPAPEYEEYEDSLRVILYPYKEYAKLTEIERLRATYQHCCVKYVNKEFLFFVCLFFLSKVIEICSMDM